MTSPTARRPLRRHVRDDLDHLVTDPGELGIVLGIWAHPDDAVVLSAGLMAAARDAGQRVVCATATLGELATSDPAGWPPERLAATRTHEARASLAALGVTEHHQLELADGCCAAVARGRAVGPLARIVDDVRPDTIVTFGPDGVTGHEDHRAVSGWASEVRALAAPRAQLLWATTTDEFARVWGARGTLAAGNAARAPLAPGETPRRPATAAAAELRLDRDAVDRKMVALRAQASQTVGLLAEMGEQRVRQWCSTESFVAADAAASPRPAVGTRRVAA